MVTGQIFDHAARLHSYEIVADIRDTLTAPAEREMLSTA
jgi:hypothetical protein